MAQINEDTINTCQPEPAQRIESLLEPYFSKHHRERCYPGLIFQQGKRTLLQFNVPASDLANLLQTKPATSNNPESGKDRPEIKGHADEIKEYIVERASKKEHWTIGTITANVAPELITLIELGKSFCLIVIPKGVKLDLTDGQHRKKAIQEIIESEKCELIRDDYFPVNLILENDLRQCQIDFRDLAQAKAVDKSLLLSFSESSGRVGITKNLIEQVRMFKGKTDKIQKAPKKKSKLIYTINYIATTVSCAFADNRNAQLENLDIKESSEALANCLNQFFSECLQTQKIAHTNTENLTVDEVITFRQECLLGVSIGIEVLGRLLYYTYDQKNNYFNSSQVSQLAQIDWSRDNTLWQDNVVRIDNTNKNSDRTYMTFGASAVADAVKIVKRQLHW